MDVRRNSRLAAKSDHGWLHQHMRRQVRQLLITSFSAASARNSRAHVATGSYRRRCSKPASEVHSHSTSSAAVHFSFARPAATTASSAATSHPDVVAPLEPAPRPPPMPCRQERTSGGNACSRAQSVGRGSWCAPRTEA